MRFLFLSLLCLAPAFYAGNAHAQNQSPMPHRTVTTAQTSAGISTPSAADPEVTIMRDAYAGKYMPATLANLSQLYWKLGAFDIGDNTAVGGYIQINECRLYKEYGKDDFEWGKIVDAMREYLRDNKDNFSSRYEVLLPVKLGVYDQEKSGFPLVDDTGFNNTKRIEVDVFDIKSLDCYNSGLGTNYPSKLMVWFSHPFNFDFLSMDEHVAQAFIVRRKQEDRRSAQRRDVYLRVRLQISRYEGNISMSQKGTLAVLRGKIDGYDVFEDVEQKRLMSSVNLDQHTVSTPTMSMPPSQIKDSMIESMQPAGTNAAP